MHPPPVVVDKSFLQGESVQAMHRFASQNRVLMTEALLYELLSNPVDRRACFLKFPSQENPVEIVMHCGYYLSKEINTRKIAPSPSLSAHRFSFKFNDALLEDSYSLPPDAVQTLDDQRHELLRDIASLRERASSMDTFFPDLASSNSAKRQAARYAAERAVGEPGSLRDFYASLRAPKGYKRAPPVKAIADDWALYRWLQIAMLFGIDLHFRFGPAVLERLSPDTEEQLEHDVLDAQYLLIGILEGRFATNEKKLRRWFRTILPNGTLIGRDA